MAMLFPEKYPEAARDSSGIALDSGIPGIDTLDHAWLEAGFLVWPRAVLCYSNRRYRHDPEPESVSPYSVLVCREHPNTTITSHLMLYAIHSIGEAQREKYS